ncbi:hypothetical protein Pfo_020799 [Paulownia fortunei]|nr:hypothetical protein Pfo_020799 [Paulownia fortunei]
MEASASVVIKVKYGDMLRRFNAQIVHEELNLSMDGLRKKILSLFSLNPDTELMLTYIDEDSDVVTLVDDDDLHDVVKQGLNPLRITVKVNAEKHGRQDKRSSASSTPLSSPRVQQPLQNLNTGVSELLRTLPEPLHEKLVKFSTDLASKASSSAPGITELVDHLSKMSLSYLGQHSQSQPGMRSSTQGGVPETSTAATETKGSEHFKVDPAATLKVLSNVRSELSTKNNESLEKLKPEATVENNEVKIHNVAGGSMEDSSSGFNAVAAALESQNINVTQPGNDALLNLVPVLLESGVVSHSVGKSAESCITSSNLPSVANNISTGKEISSSGEPKLGSNPASVSASDPMKGDYVDDRIRSALPDGFGKSPGSVWAPSPGSSDFPGSFCVSSPAYECPFSGIAVGNVSAVPPHPAYEAVPLRRSISQNDGSGNIFHSGVRCDGCGIHPITGPRFKSKVKVDYDLCSICFEEMGNYSDYIRMDRPAVYRHHMSFKGLHDARARDRSPMLQQVYRGSRVKPGAAKLDSRFIQDVNIFDGTVMAPLTPFTKIWRMRNNGTVMWPQKTQLVWIGGDKLSNELSVGVQIPAAGLMIDQELDVAVDFISPELPGRYISYWRMASPSGQKFGQRVWVLIQVYASGKETPCESVRNLNLNLPPVSSCLTCPEIINVDPEPMVEDSHPEADNSKKMVEVVQPNTEQELKFPINDSLLVGNGASSYLPSSASPPVSYPIIDLSDVAPALPSVPPAMLNPLPPPAPFAYLAPVASARQSAVDLPGKTQVEEKLPPAPSAYLAPVATAQQSAVDLPGKTQIEEKLLKELEEMGFKQVDLNKEILRMNEYDLEQAVDDLCGVAEWDPILEELHEMGFDDTEMNKKLLKKNNGSIKRVVMDLIAGEKI